MAGYLVGGRFLSGQITLRQLKPQKLTVQLALNTPDSIQADIGLPLTDPETGVTIHLPDELVPARDFIAWVENGQVIAAGLIGGDPFTFPGSGKVVAEGVWGYFDRRFVLPVLTPGQLPRDVTSKWDGLSLGSIAKRLVQQACAHPAANLPIDYEPDVAGTAEREYPGSDGMRVGQALSNLTQVDGGPDIDFRPKLTEDRRHIRFDMVTGTPLAQGGADHYWDVSAPGPHATVVGLDRDGRDLASRAFLTGTTVKNIFSDGEFRDGTGSWVAGGVNNVIAAMNAGPTELALGAKGYALVAWSGDGAGGIASGPNTVTVEEGEWYVLSCMAQGTTKPVRFFVRFYDEDGQIGEVLLLNGTVVPTHYEFFNGFVQVPAGAVKMEVLLYAQPGQEWHDGDTLRTTMWHGYLTPDLGDAALPYFYDELQIQASAENDDLLDAGFPLMESWESRPSVRRVFTLQAYADESVVRYSAHTETFTLSVKRDQPPVLGTYRPGDWARIRVGKNPRIPAGTYRVRIIRISFGATGNVTLECAPERVAGGYPVPSSNRAWLNDQLRALSARIDEQGRA